MERQKSLYGQNTRSLFFDKLVIRKKEKDENLKKSQKKICEEKKLRKKITEEIFSGDVKLT